MIVIYRQKDPKFDDIEVISVIDAQYTYSSGDVLTDADWLRFKKLKLTAMLQLAKRLEADR